MRKIAPLIFLFFLCAFAVFAAEQKQGAIEPIRELDAGEKISSDQLRQWQLEKKPLVLFDARDSRLYDTAHIEGAVLPLPRDYYRQRELFRARVLSDPPDFDAALRETMKNYPRHTPIVTYCNEGCKASAFLLVKMKGLGFTNVKAMEPGIGAWEAGGYPVVKGPVSPKKSSGL